MESSSSLAEGGVAYAEVDTSVHTAGVWKADADSDECACCQAKFTVVKRRHHCRKCGSLVCAACSKKKMKLAPTAKDSVRVCDHCAKCNDSEEMQRKASNVMVIYPPEWVDPTGITKCFKCNRGAGGTGAAQMTREASTSRLTRSGSDLKSDSESEADVSRGSSMKSKGLAFLSSAAGKIKGASHVVQGRKQLHHCRTCGRMFCSACTQKHEVPAAFKKKTKAGPVRVCEMCLMLISSGAELAQVTAPTGGPTDDGPEAPPPPPDSDGEDGDGFTSNPMTAVLRSESTADESRQSGTGWAVPAVLGVMWENKTSDVCGDDNEDGEETIARLHTLPNMTLTKIHQMLLRQAPDISNYDQSQWAYLCNGEEISQSHYHVFEARHFTGSMLFLRFKSSRMRTASVAAAVDATINSAKNRKQLAMKMEEENKLKAAEAAKIKAKPKFHTKFSAPESKGKEVDVTKVAVIAADAGKPPGFTEKIVKKVVEEKQTAATSSEGDLSLESLKNLDPFQARSIAIFGANLKGDGGEKSPPPSAVLITEEPEPDMVPPPP